MLYNTQFSITLKPHGQIKPIITYGFGHEDTNIQIELVDTVTLDFDLTTDAGPKTFYMLFENKTNDTPDMAVEIEKITVEGMTVDRFKWAGLYRPDYPEPWASSQTDLPEVHRHATYLGWNGRWELTFGVPIFRWIHTVENLGWIYD
jgi:hypothetical protein